MNSDFWVKSEAICQWFSRMTKSRVKIIGKSHHEWTQRRYLRQRMYYFFLTRYFTYNSAKTSDPSLISPLSQGRSFLTYYCDVTTVDLWRHANVGCWHYDVILVDCSCTRKLAQRRSLLVNNSREYRYLITRYSWLSVFDSIHMPVDI